MHKRALFSIISSIILLAGVPAAALAQQGGTLRGKVVYSEGDSPLHSVVVQITQLKRKVETDENGVYEFTDVPPGNYSVVAHMEGFPDAAQTVTVTAGGAAMLDFTMRLTGVKEQVTVTASGSEQSTFDALQSVSSVDSLQILERASTSLGEVLDGEPGVAKRSFGPGNSRPVIRGFDGDRVLVSTDGVRVGSLASQSGDHGEPIDPLTVERIEVVKGPATLLYGSNAIGGIVNAISGHDEGSHPGVRGYLSTVGGFNNAQAGLSGGFEFGTKNWSFWGNGSGQRTGDYDAGGDFGTVHNTFTRSGEGIVGFGHFSGKTFFTTNYSYYQSKYGIPLDPADDEVRDLTLRRHDIRVKGGYRDADNFLSGLQVSFDYSDYQHQELVDDAVGTTFKNHVFSYRGVFDQQRRGNLTGSFGVEGYRRGYETVGDEILVNGRVVLNNFSAFGLEELNYERVKFQFGGRVENNRYRTAPGSGLPDRDFTGFSGAAGMRINLWNNGAFVANYTHSYRAPALEELYNNGPHDGTLLFEVGNPALRPETSDGIDLSLRHQAEKFHAEANVYYYNLKNFVFLAPRGVVEPTSGLEFGDYLQGDSRFVGTEVNFERQLHPKLWFSGGVDYVNAELKTGQPLPRIPPLRGRLGMDARFDNISIRPELILASDQSRVFTNETRTAGYGTFNLSGSYTIPRTHYAHVFSVVAYNLNNKFYLNHISVIKDLSPEIGRGVRFTYTVRFF
jgi:iron complex outermembrane receptor protein